MTSLAMNDRLSLEAGLAALNRGDTGGALSVAERLVKAGQGTADGHFLAARALLQMGRLRAALDAVAQSIAESPIARNHALHARLLLVARRELEALSAVEAGRARKIEDGWTADTLGCVLTALGRHREARDLFEKAVCLSANNPAYRCNLAACLVFHGFADAAAAQYAAALTFDPACSQAHFGLSGLGPGGEAVVRLERIENALAQAVQPEDLMRLHHAAARACQEIGDHDGAARHLKAAGRVRRQTIPCDIGASCAQLTKLPDLFASGIPDVPESAGGPIFIVGLPRTGTTLVDRIISSHAEIVSAGELDTMPLAVKLLSGVRSPVLLDDETARRSAALDPATLRRAYLDRAAAFLPGGHSEGLGRFTDKLPHNFLYLGHIARAMPEARIICLRRGAMDSVWANYSHLFAVGSREYDYSYDLMDCARYYRAFDQLMTRWQQLLGPRLLQLRYEDLILDQERETRRLLEHCGLSWNQDCLDPAGSDGAVATPSALQVRQPLHARSIGRWRHHPVAMAPVAAYFDSHGISLD